MATPELPFFQAPAPALRHLLLPHAPRRIDAEGRSMVPKAPRYVDRVQHGSALAARIDEIEREVGAAATLLDGEPPGRVGISLEILTPFGHTIGADDAHKLTAKSEIKILLTVPEKDEQGRIRTKIVLHVPYGQLNTLREKFRRFGEDLTVHGNTPNPWIANLDEIARAAVPALWTDEEEFPTDEGVLWWEFWLMNEENNLEAFQFLATRFGVNLKRGVLKLPERRVMIGSATRAQLMAALPLLDCIAELRRARVLNLEWTDLTAAEQQEIVVSTAGRVAAPPPDAPSVCLLDSGVNRAHPLLDQVLDESDNQTIFGDGDPSDCCPGDGHGTLSAGLAAFGDLRDILAHSESIPMRHRLEGVKMIDANCRREPENFGDVTRQAVSTAESQNALRNRVFAMPISAEGGNDGRPSSWSAAVDAIAFGSEEVGEPKRLLILSAGNTGILSVENPGVYPEENLRSPIENPGQAWNALTVGAITHRSIRETDPASRRLRELASIGSLSPHSRTSSRWDSHWPIKPEIVLEGGNVAAGDDAVPQQRDSLDLLSTSKIIRGRPIASFRATSAATALAGKLAAEIRADYPNLLPETVRGLMVHSARWNPTMLAGVDPHRAGSSASVQSILRCYGYGEPKVDRARASASNAVTMFREETLRPFTNEGRLNDCHVHSLPIPVDSLGDPLIGDAIMRVTLSYFVAPSPSASNRMPGSRYRYAGCLLRFETRNVNESEENFLSRVGQTATDEEQEDEEAVGQLIHEAPRINNSRWALGPALRAKGGSLLQDVWRGPAADLLTMNQIAVFPKKGWWSYRSFERGSPWYLCKQRPVRYSLIVSIETIADVPLYTEISDLVTVAVDA